MAYSIYIDDVIFSIVCRFLVAISCGEALLD